MEIEQESQYSIYIVPDKPEVLGPCESISFGINWGGPHITMCKFTSGNIEKIPAILDYIKNYLNPQIAQNTLWNPLCDIVEKTKNQYVFKSKTLKKISDILKICVENVKDNDFHIYNRLGVNTDLNVLSKTTWSLIMIKKTNKDVEWLHHTKVPVYCLD